MSDDLRFKDRYRIPSARLASWDYRWAGIYSVTICTRGRVCWFGEVMDGQVALSPAGRVVAEEWRKIPQVSQHVFLDEWIVMPDHMHGILIFQNRLAGEERQEQASSRLSRSLGAMIGQFKSSVTKRIRLDLKHHGFAWQERFYDTILRDLPDLERVRAYIRTHCCPRTV